MKKNEFVMWFILYSLRIVFKKMLILFDMNILCLYVFFVMKIFFYKRFIFFVYLVSEIFILDK